MLFYTTGYELARALTEERTSKAMAGYRHRQILKEIASRDKRDKDDQEGEVIELVFGSHCDEIGA